MPWHPPLLLAATDALVVLPFVSIFFLLLVFLSIWLIRSVDVRLIVLGLLTAVLAAWCGQLPVPEGVNMHVVPGQPSRPGQPGEVGWSLRGGGVAEPLGRISALLVLGGVAVSILGRWSTPPAPTTREEAAHGKPV